MSTRHSLRLRMRSLRDLHDVFDAMRNLARAEISKVARTQAFRHHLREELSIIAAASAAYYPPAFAPKPQRSNLYLVIGSERGLCGDFNARIISYWNGIDARLPEGEVLVIGSALASRFTPTRRTVTRMAGPATIDDVDAVLTGVLRRVAEVTAGNTLGLVAIAADREGVHEAALLPFSPPVPKRDAVTPRLMLPRDAFVQGFVDQYVDAALHDLFATSLLAEHQARLTRMTLAIDRIDREITATTRRTNRLRQEAITQEVETLLLSTVISLP